LSLIWSRTSLRRISDCLLSNGADLVIETRIAETGFWGTTVKGNGRLVYGVPPFYFSDHVTTAFEKEDNLLAVLDEPEVAFYLVIEVKAVRPKDGGILYEHRYRYSSNVRPVISWRIYPDSLKEEIQKGLSGISRDVVEDLCSGYQPKIYYGPGVVIPETDYCIMRPYVPEMLKIRYKISTSPLLIERLIPTFDAKDVVPVNTIRPTFVWEAFPRERDLQMEKMLSDVTAVAYDLRIWKHSGDGRTTLAYEKRGIPAVNGLRERVVTPIKTSEIGTITDLPPRTIRERVAAFTLDAPLEPASTYTWSVRARFVLNGQTRLTPWARFSGRPDLDTCSNSAGDKHYFVFKTSARASVQ
jgi:hypothetical protein